MKKAFTKMIMLGVALMMCLGFLSACGRQEFSYDCVLVYVYDDEKFDNEEWTVEDFNWENVRGIVYRTYSWGTRCLLVFLKEHSERLVRAAKAHIEKLDFVERVDFDFLEHLT